MSMRVHSVSRQGLARVFRAVVVLFVVALAAVALTACDSTPYSQTIRISAETMNVDGLFARIEYLKDGKVENAIHLVDGDGDGVVDGKSGPRTEGNWPIGWLWFDSMYQDTIVGETEISFDGQKVIVTAESTYEFVVGEYEVRSGSQP